MIIVIAIILYSLGFFILGFNLAMYAVRKHIKEVSKEVSKAYFEDDCRIANAFYDRIYNHFVNED
jgi:hypothetical protein